MLLLMISAGFANWMHRLGGVGLILLALVDNSVIPLPGSEDAAVILLTTARKEFWWYYAVMALVGSIIGGYLMYRLGIRGGKEVLEKRVGEKRAAKVYSFFERYGFWSIVAGALGPPPTPIAAFLLTAGAMQYPKKKFLAALGVGRTIRYAALAYLASRYGHHLFHWIYRYYKPILIVLIILGVVGGVLAIYYLKKYKRNSPDEKSETRPKPDSLAA